MLLLTCLFDYLMLQISALKKVIFMTQTSDIADASIYEC